MASANTIQVSAADTGLLKFDQTSETAAEVTSLLQKDLDSHHTFFNPSGYHNHVRPPSASIHLLPFVS